MDKMAQKHDRLLHLVLWGKTRSEEWAPSSSSRKKPAPTFTPGEPGADGTGPPPSQPLSFRPIFLPQTRHSAHCDPRLRLRPGWPGRGLRGSGLVGGREGRSRGGTGGPRPRWGTGGSGRAPPRSGGCSAGPQPPPCGMPRRGSRRSARGCRDTRPEPLSAGGNGGATGGTAGPARPPQPRRDPRGPGAPRGPAANPASPGIPPVPHSPAESGRATPAGRC